MPFLQPSDKDSQRLLGVYTYYRFSLGCLLGAMHWTGLSKDTFGYSEPELFSLVTLAYIILCASTLSLHWKQKLNAHSRQVPILLVIDFVALVLMIYASGDFSSGLGYLLLIPIALGSTFLNKQIAIGLAAFATLLVLGMSLLSIVVSNNDISTFFSAGVTGVSLFVTAIAFRIFSERVQSSEYATQKQTEQTKYLQLISQRIVETMRTGIVVVDRDLSVRLINQAAISLLSVDDKFDNISDITEINHRLKYWRNDGIIPAKFSFTMKNDQSLRVGFSALEDPRFPSIMLFIEDLQRLNQEAQQLKLASLGRLTASIAHEIRNPLGAISHAGQLLTESETIGQGDRDLLDIIHNHSQRINIIINSILEFSRRNNANPEVVNVNQWLNNFVEEYQQHRQCSLAVDAQARDVYAKIDPHHLFQIINNLADNGLRHSESHLGVAKLDFDIGIQATDERPYIDVIDYGEGVTDENLRHIFEPFYTTESTGSGLGLYLCKELSEANQATLNYRYHPDSHKSTFRLTMAHPKKQIELQ
ncbi:MAG: two-component system sensor histidine kinase PilS (NtrC family) [Cellvibrionaceae bacterium]|jgi:two-component system sensor histidine kinase PilS (NtrC family)